MGDIFGWKLISEHIIGNHHIQLCIKSHRSPSLSLAICIYPSEQTYTFCQIGSCMADVHAAGDGGDLTPFMVAAEHGHVKILQYFRSFTD